MQSEFNMLMKNLSVALKKKSVVTCMIEIQKVAQIYNVGCLVLRWYPPSGKQKLG